MLHFVFMVKPALTADPHQFTRNAWEANAEVWDARMGDEGNEFFNTKDAPNCMCELE